MKHRPVAATVALLTVTVLALQPRAEVRVRVERIANNPIVRPESLPEGYDETSIMFPCLIRVPSWLPNPLGEYYLYWANHGESPESPYHFIRLAYADNVEGPYTNHDPGTLRITQTGFTNHISSPEVHIDNEAKKIRMYFHGKHNNTDSGFKCHCAKIATSDDGIHFAVMDEYLDGRYWRVRRGDNGTFWRVRGDGSIGIKKSPDGLLEWQSMGSCRPDEPLIPRHPGIKLEGPILYIFYTNKGSTPEHIRMIRIDLNTPHETWPNVKSIEVMRPELPYEGSDLPVTTSKGGGHSEVHALVDPAVYTENGQDYLLYCGRGEGNICMAKIWIDDDEVSQTAVSVPATTATQRGTSPVRQYGLHGSLMRVGGGNREAAGTLIVVRESEGRPVLTFGKGAGRRFTSPGGR